MTNNSQGDELFGLLRKRGVRKKVAKSVSRLDGNSRRNGATGAEFAEKVVGDLEAAATDIRKRVLTTDRRRSQGARKAARTRARNATKRKTTAKQGAGTRARVATAHKRTTRTRKSSARR